MEFGKKVVEELKKVGESREKGISVNLDSLKKKINVKVNMDNMGANINVLDCDRLGCKVETFEIVNNKSVTIKDLKVHAEKLASKINYLPGGLSVIEIDDNNALMRSTNVDDYENNTSYYEVIVNKNKKVDFKRYYYTEEQKERALSNFVMSFELIERLFNNLGESVS